MPNTVKKGPTVRMRAGVLEGLTEKGIWTRIPRLKEMKMRAGPGCLQFLLPTYEGEEFPGAYRNELVWDTLGGEPFQQLIIEAKDRVTRESLASRILRCYRISSNVKTKRRLVLFWDFGKWWEEMTEEASRLREVQEVMFA